MEDNNTLEGEYLTGEIEDPTDEEEITAEQETTPSFMDSEPTVGSGDLGAAPPFGTNAGFPPRSNNVYTANMYNSASYSRPAPQQAPTPPAPKKSGKGFMVLGIILALIAGAAIAVFSIYVLPKLFDGSADTEESSTVTDNSNVLENDNSKTESGTDSGSDETSVENIVPVAPLPGVTYDDLVTVYENWADSCVTILCTVQINNGFYPQTGQSLGSGFIVEGTKDGENGFYIVTNHHVIDGATEIQVKYNDGKLFKAELLGSDDLTDIAVLKTERTDVKPITIGDSGELKVGQTVVAIGTPSAEEFQNTMSYGIISGLNREIKMTNDYGTIVKTMTLIQTTATLNPGNSGGPLINMAGQVVGINTMKLMQDYEGIGFAIPSTQASYIINSLIQYGKFIDNGESFVSGTAQLGITGGTVTDEVREEYDLGDDCPDGILVTTVNRGTSVYQAGLSIYDVITEFNGTKVKTIEELKDLISKSKAGAEVSLTFYRLGRRGEESGYHTIKFKLDTAK